MRIGVFFPSVEHAPLDEMVGRVEAVAAQGFQSAWLPQSSSFVAIPCGGPEDRSRTLDLLAQVARG